MSEICIVVPVYKVEPYIHRCIDSVLMQTFTDFELVLVDDGSPDRCPMICDEYAETDQRVHVIHQKNNGLSAARNAGIDWAFSDSDSEWMTFIDSDDWIHPAFLETLISGAKETCSDIIIAGYERTDGALPVVDIEKLVPKIWPTEDFFREHNDNAVVAWGKLYRKKCFEGIRYPVGLVHEDEFTTYKLLFEYKNVAVISQPLYAYFQNMNGIMGVGWKPSRLLTVTAQEECAQFFLARNNKKMFLWALQTMFANLGWQLDEIRKSNSQIRKEYEKQTFLLYKTKLKLYRKYLPVSTNGFVYTVVHPHLMNMYYRIKHAGRLGIRGTVFYAIKKIWKDNL